MGKLFCQFTQWNVYHTQCGNKLTLQMPVYKIKKCEHSANGVYNFCNSITKEDDI